MVPKHAATAITASGWQLVVWKQEGEQAGVWGRILDQGGAVVGEPFRVSERATDPTVAARGRRDEFLVAWTKVGPQYQVVARRFDRDGKPIGDEFVISEAGQAPALAYGGKRDEFVVTWLAGRVYGARLPAGSSTPSPGFLISSGGARTRDISGDLAYDSRTGGYLVAWERYHLDTGVSRAFARALPASPAGPLGRQRRLAEPGSVQSASPNVIYNRRTREYLAFWAGGGSLVRRVRPDGRPYGDEVSAMRGTDFDLAAVPGIAAARDGHYEILLWGDDFADDPPGSVVFRRRMGAELKLGRRLRRVSSADPRVTGTGGAIAYSRATDRFRAIWVEGREQRDPNQFPGDPPSNWEVWARVL